MRFYLALAAVRGGELPEWQFLSVFPLQAAMETCHLSRFTFAEVPEMSLPRERQANPSKSQTTAQPRTRESSPAASSHRFRRFYLPQSSRLRSQHSPSDIGRKHQDQDVVECRPSLRHSRPISRWWQRAIAAAKPASHLAVAAELSHLVAPRLNR